MSVVDGEKKSGKTKIPNFGQREENGRTKTFSPAAMTTLCLHGRFPRSNENARETPLGLEKINARGPLIYLGCVTSP